MEGDPKTDEMRVEQIQREREERARADADSTEEGTAQHSRRAEKASYLAEKLAERDRSERKNS
jgi:hypothetical protein